MNLLLYDESRAVSRFARSILLGHGHRVSLSSDAADANLKLDTGLFDAIVIGPGGAPKELADKLDESWPELPILLVGVEHALPAQGRIRAVLPRPLEASRLSAAIERLRREQKPVEAMPASVFAGGDQVSCTLTRRSASALLFEPTGEVLPFARFFSSHPRVEAALGEQRVPCEVAFAEGRFVGVRITGE